MKPIAFVPLLMFFTWLVGASASGQALDFLGAVKPQERVKVSIVSEVSTAAAGKPFRVAVKLEHAPHVHSYGKELPPDGTGKTTKLTWNLPPGWKAEELPWPAVKDVPSTGGTMSRGYDGVVYLPATITPAGNAGGTAEISVKASMLVCDESSCLPKNAEARLGLTISDKIVPDAAGKKAIEESLASTIPGQPAASMSAARPNAKAAASEGRNLGTYLLFAFIGGLILNVMPCVFPVLGIKVLGVVQQAGGDRRQVVMHGLAYTLGVLICFWILGAVVVSLGKGWGFQLQSTGFLYGLTLFFLIFALNMAGLFEIGASAVGVGAHLQSKHGYGGSFFSGLLATVVATPCSAPFLGSALGFAVTLPIAKALFMFTMIGLGLAAPFLLLSFAPALVSALPRPGAWMESFKQAMSFLLFGTVGYLVWVLTGKVEGQPMLFVLFSLVLVGLGCWIYGRWFLPHKSARTRSLALLFSLATVAAAIWFGWPHAEEKWEAWSPERVAELRAQGTPVYVDFTAKWCLTCQYNKRVYHDKNLMKQFRDKKVAMLRADWTNDDPRIGAALEQLGKAAIPVNALYSPGKEEPVILPELLTVDNVTAALRTLK